MNRHKGFTLIELLAVIVILGILLLVAVPKLRNVINNSKQKLREQDGELFIRELNNEISALNIENKGKFNPQSCLVENGNVTCEGTKIDMDTSQNKIDGIVYLDGGEVKNYDLMIANVEYTNIEYTNERCFDISIKDNIVSLDDYYDYIGNDSNKGVCPRNVVIPRLIEGKIVSDIGYGVFSGKNLTGVIIPNSITSIGGAAFENNELTNIIIPGSVKGIYNGAFSNNQLSSVTILDGVTTISQSAFENNYIQNIDIPNSVTSIGYNAFKKNKLKSVKISNSITKIEDGTFSYNELTNIIIPDSVTSIGLEAFAYNYLTSVIIPDSVTSIDNIAFSPNNLISVEIGTNNSSLTNLGDFAFDNYSEDEYGPNNITNLRIHKPSGSIDLTRAGFDEYENIVVIWN